MAARLPGHAARLSHSGHRHRSDGQDGSVPEQRLEAAHGRAVVCVRSAREDVPGTARRRAVRDGLYRRLAGPPFGAHGGQGVGDFVSPSGAAAVSRRRRFVYHGPGAGRDRPGEHRETARAAGRKGGTVAADAGQFRLPRGRRVGVRGPRPRSPCAPDDGSDAGARRVRGGLSHHRTGGPARRV